jgi:hypothetical protein
VEVHDFLQRHVVVAPAEAVADTLSTGRTEPEGDAVLVLNETTNAAGDGLDKTKTLVSNKLWFK